MQITFIIAVFSRYKRNKLSYRLVYSLLYIIGCIFLSSSLCFILKEHNLILINKILFYGPSIITFFIFFDIIGKQNITKQAIKKQYYEFKNINTNNPKPDIYHILLDSHEGFSDKNYCDEEFKIALKDRGFYIYENFKSNYPTTSFSIPSMFNMN